MPEFGTKGKEEEVRKGEREKGKQKKLLLVRDAG